MSSEVSSLVCEYKSGGIITFMYNDLECSVQVREHLTATTYPMLIKYDTPLDKITAEIEKAIRSPLKAVAFEEECGVKTVYALQDMRDDCINGYIKFLCARALPTMRRLDISRLYKEVAKPLSFSFEGNTYKIAITATPPSSKSYVISSLMMDGLSSNATLKSSTAVIADVVLDYDSFTFTGLTTVDYICYHRLPTKVLEVFIQSRFSERIRQADAMLLTDVKEEPTEEAPTSTARTPDASTVEPKVEWSFAYNLKDRDLVLATCNGVASMTRIVSSSNIVLPRHIEFTLFDRPLANSDATIFSLNGLPSELSGLIKSSMLSMRAAQYRAREEDGYTVIHLGQVFHVSDNFYITELFGNEAVEAIKEMRR